MILNYDKIAGLFFIAGIALFFVNFVIFEHPIILIKGLVLFGIGATKPFWHKKKRKK